LQYYDKPVITTLFLIQITNYQLLITNYLYNQGTQPNLRSLPITHYQLPMKSEKVRKWEGCKTSWYSSFWL